MKLMTLADLLGDQLRDLYSAETQLLKALPQMAQAATSGRLRIAFENHLAETQTQVHRLEEIFVALSLKPGRKECKAVECLIQEGEDLIGEEAEATVHDAALIAAAQRIEHYEIAGYGCARTFASLLGYDFAVELLNASLDEEAATDALLTEIAMSGINQAAAAPAMAGGPPHDTGVLTVNDGLFPENSV